MKLSQLDLSLRMSPKVVEVAPLRLHAELDASSLYFFYLDDVRCRDMHGRNSYEISVYFATLDNKARLLMSRSLLA